MATQSIANRIQQDMQHHIPDISVTVNSDGTLSIIYGGFEIGGPPGLLSDYTEYTYNHGTRTLTHVLGEEMNNEHREALNTAIEKAFPSAGQSGGRRHRKSRKAQRKSRKAHRKAHRKSSRKASRKSRRNYRR